MPPRLARLVALLAAVALVGGAFVLRGALAGDDEGSGGDGGGPDGGAGAGQVRLVCDEDLGDAACDALGAIDGVDSMEVMSADDAVAAMSDPDDPDVVYDAWATLDPWPQILDVARDVARLNAVADVGEPVPMASSTPVTLTRETGGSACTTPVTWACLADEAEAGADVGMPTLRSAAGTLVLGLAATGLEGTADFGIADVTDTEVEAQLGDLLDSTDQGTLEEQDAVATRPGEFQALVTIEGLGAPTAGTRQGMDLGLTVLDLTPAATIGVVLAPLGPDGPAAVDRLADAPTDKTVADGLAAAGWSGDPGPSQGLPVPDLLYRLDEEFTR